ncbi:coatomer subunit beta' [Trichomonascus vanleenenianus]|uniref:coatomer subunit beta' n=1 Tax=Trichomonascus vanleenenianus TaxID=2268995 RepID=UPI003ECA15C8
MKLDVKKLYQNHSDRVKAIDIHPTEPWVLSTFYSGRVQLVNYESGAIVKSIEVSDVPVRAGRFIARKNWIVLGSDDFQIRVYNYNTGAKVKQFEAHPDYIRCLAVHPTQPFVISAGDDMTIKLWNWEMEWKNTQTFEGHGHYIMYVAFNPKDPNTFASACLDRTVKIWSLGSSTPNFTLDTHDSRGLNFVEYYPQSDKPYIITTSDDRTIRVWDYQTKSCVATLEGHQHNVSFAVFHPELPIIISGSEDSTIKIWNANTYKLEQTHNYGLERAWCAMCRKGSNVVALGFDAGTVVLQLGKEEPAISMDPNGKIVWSRHSEVHSTVIKGGEEVSDGEILPLTAKELGSVEVYPTKLVHSPNGRFVAVTGDGEYIIYTALAWRNKSFGTALDFAWAQDSNEYAVLDTNHSIRLFKNFKERPLGHVSVDFAPQRIFGGTLLGVKGDGFVMFYDWETGYFVRRVDIEATQVVWADSGSLVAIATEESFFTLTFDAAEFARAVEAGEWNEEDGVETAFEVDQDVADAVRTGRWVGDCFIYTTFSNRLNYLVGPQTYTISHFDKQMYLLGYIPRDNSVYLADRDINVTSYHLSLAVVEYQTVVLRGDMDYARELLDQVPEKERTKVARFLEAQGQTEEAFEVTLDDEHKFDLALTLGRLGDAEDIAANLASEHKWKQLGDTALERWNVVLAERCFEKAGDLESLLLVYTSTGNKKALAPVAAKAAELGKYNLAMNALWFIGDVDGCVALLNKSGRSSEAALFALTYGGDINGSVKLWKESLAKDGRTKIADTIADPAENADLFPSNVGQKSSMKNVTNDLIDVEDVDAEEDSQQPTPQLGEDAEEEAVEADDDEE